MKYHKERVLFSLGDKRGILSCQILHAEIDRGILLVFIMTTSLDIRYIYGTSHELINEK